MRTLFIIIVLLFVSFSSFAQEFTVVKAAKKTTQLETVEIAGKVFNGYTSRTGSQVIIINRTKRDTGEIYESKMYLGHKSSKTVTIDGSTFAVWSNKPYDKWEISEDVKFYYYKIGRTGNPTKVALQRN